MKDLRASHNDAYVLVYQLQGSAFLNIEGRTVQLEHGDMVVVDAAKTSGFSFLNAHHQICICLPRATVDTMYSADSRLVGRKICGKTQFGQMVGEFVHELSSVLNSPKNEVEAMHRALLSLLKPLLST